MPVPIQSSEVENPNTGEIERLTENFETSDGTENFYNMMVGEGNTLSPDYSSPDRPQSWGKKSGLIALGPESAAAMWLKLDKQESPTGYFFTGSYEILDDDLQDGQSISLSISKPSSFSGPLAAWRLSILKDQQ